MESTEAAGVHDPITENMYTGSQSSFPGDLVDSSDLSAADREQIAAVMNALARLREAERALAEASRRFMKLSEQDMRALHYLIAAKRQNAAVTPKMLSAHMSMSAASVTKLINRLERDGHVIRKLHPSDRRAYALEVTAETTRSARETVGRTQARRIHAAADLTSRERDAVIRFLNGMTEELSLDNVDWTKQP
ncbi:MarR family winged helix-turn-helix transcriptional regulator [Brevibacterium sp. VCM10]|uniref:MarR family winged helix-turn-helix transcriptional regulator n=1 Tax=Brevibacterium sp. VCM10 TaxID=1381751 RepID=UPI00046FD0AB|nr:MarR family transcriptional regulator [Brevibacterium sp. VCM10]